MLLRSVDFQDYFLGMFMNYGLGPSNFTEPFMASLTNKGVKRSGDVS